MSDPLDRVARRIGVARPDDGSLNLARRANAVSSVEVGPRCCPVVDRARLHDLEPRLTDVREEVRVGLAQRPRRISPKFLYDRRGSQLFESITQQPEYYPTRAEIDILSRAIGEIYELHASPLTPERSEVRFGDFKEDIDERITESAEFEFFPD